MGFFGKLLSRKARVQRALKVQQPETCGVAPEALERMCVALDSPRSSQGTAELPTQDSRSLRCTDSPTHPVPAFEHASMPASGDQLWARAQPIDEPLDEDGVALSEHLQQASSVVSARTEEQVCDIDEAVEEAPVQLPTGKTLSPESDDCELARCEAALDRDLDVARQRMMRCSIAADDLEVDHETLLQQLQESRERLRALEEKED